MQVLGNAELRAKYDAHGAEGLDVNFMDSAEFFAALFGSDRFEHLVGELMIAAAARHGADFNTNQLRKLQVGATVSAISACNCFAHLLIPMRSFLIVKVLEFKEYPT